MSNPVKAQPLQGIGVLVTRPAHQAESLCRNIERAGGSAIRFPVLEIGEPLDEQGLLEVIERLDDYDWAIFISANAVNKALGRILAKRHWPATLRIAVVGRRSAEELERLGQPADLCPEREFSSEGLLELPEMQAVSGKRIVIFRGNGGRELLADTLRQRGAEVDYVEAYRRVRPTTDPGPLLSSWVRREIDIVLVSSVESLNNLCAMLGAQGRPLLLDTPLLVVSERILPLTHKLGFRRPPLVAENATDQAVLDALVTWAQKRFQKN